MEMKKEGDEGDPSLTLVHLKQDAFSVLSSIKHEKKLRLMKTRWLMGVPKNFKLSRGSFNDLRKPIFYADMYLPEPFLRNDSVFSEVAKGYLVNCFSSSKKDQPVGNFVKEIIFPLSEDGESQGGQCSLVRRVFLPMLDDLNINSLCILADLVTRKSVKFEKSRPRLESVTKRYLPMVFEKPSLFEDALGLQTQIMEVFRDPKSFKENNVPRLSKACTSYRCDVDMILEKLEDLSIHALDAMRRKLCMCPSSLYAEPCRHGSKRKLIGTLRTKIELIGDGMPENLARALRVGSLSMKLMNGHFDSTLPEFLEVPYEIEALQNEILKAVWSVPNLPFDEVKKLQLSPDLDAKVARNRSQIKYLLTECLFQCDELKIPESILRAISTINSYGGEKTTKEKDPKSFRENDVPRLTKACTSYRCDVDMILEKLEDLSRHALDAMRRKLCMCPSSLYAEPWRDVHKKRLISTLRMKIELIGDGMPENLARALRVGSLSVKLMNGHFDSTLPEFLEVPYEIEALQNEILKAVWSVPNLPLDEVKKLQLSPDLDAKVARNRSQIKNLLTECLFQCDELKIPESILRVISTINSYGGEKTTKEKNPKSFRKNNVPPLSKACTSYRCDVNMILEKLEDLSLHALDAMRRKLCMCPSSLYEEPCTNRNKKQLIGTLRRKIEKLIGDGMPENLARALRVASLSVKLMNGHFDSTLPEFLEVPYEIEALQNEILKAVWSVPNLPPDEVKKLQLSPDLDAKVERNMSQIKNLLTECLFQCDELKIPESILRAISTINSYGGEKTTKEKIEEELICMLNMGSCMKQLVWDLSEHPNIDQEFWCAYKDESEIDDSSSNDDDDDDVYDIDDKENYCSNYEKVDIPVGNESFSATHMEQQEDVSVAMRTSNITSKIPLPSENDEKCLRKEGVKNLRVMSGDKSLSKEHLHVLQECCQFMPMDEPFLPKTPEYLFPTLSELTKSSLTNSDLSALQDVTGNEYLIIEGICDEVSLFAHKFIGCMMEKLIKAEGVHLDPASRSYLLGGTSVPEKQEGELQKPSVNDTGGLVFIQAVNELVPSFPKSGMRRLLEVLKQ